MHFAAELQGDGTLSLHPNNITLLLPSFFFPSRPEAASLPLHLLDSPDRFLSPFIKHKTVFLCKQRVEIKQQQLLFARLSGENLQINLPVLPSPSSWASLLVCVLFMSLSRRPRWAPRSVCSHHIQNVFTLRPQQAANMDVDYKQQKSWCVLSLSRPP